jgi:hypothetical protein
MKIPCPHCTNNLPYNHLQAGKSFQCPYCKKPFVMLPFEKLPPEFQHEYRKELEIKKKNQETEQKKKEALVNVANEMQQQTLIRPEEESLGQLFNLDFTAHQNTRNANLEEAHNDVPECKMYIALKRFPRIFKVYAGIGVLLSVIYVFYNICILLSAEKPMEILFLIFPNLIYNISAAAIAVLLFWYIAYLNALLINVADDLKASKEMLKRLAFSQTSNKP